MIAVSGILGAAIAAALAISGHGREALEVLGGATLYVLGAWSATPAPHKRQV